MPVLTIMKHWFQLEIQFLQSILERLSVMRVEPQMSLHTPIRACWRHCRPASHRGPTMWGCMSIMVTTFLSPMKTTTLSHQTVLN